MGKRILLVEGKDDMHVFANLFQVRDVSECFEIKGPHGRSFHDEDFSGGVEALLDSIPAQFTRYDLDRLAVVVDADDKGAPARWDSIRGQVKRAIEKGAGGAEILPESHDESGIVIDIPLEFDTPRTLRFGAWIMPDNRSLGMVEDFVAGLIRSGDAMLPRVDTFLDSIPSHERRFIPNHRPKARIHTWLAVSKQPGRPMGQAIGCDNCLDPHHPSTEPFLAWLKRALVD